MLVTLGATAATVLARDVEEGVELGEDAAGGVEDEELVPEEGVAGAAELVWGADVGAAVAGLDAAVDEEARVEELAGPVEDAVGVDEVDDVGAEDGTGDAGADDAAGAAAAVRVLAAVWVTAPPVLVSDVEEGVELGEDAAGGVEDEELVPEEGVAGAAELVWGADVGAAVVGLDAAVDEEAGVLGVPEPDADAVGEDEEDDDGAEDAADEDGADEVAGADAALTVVGTVLVGAATVLAGDDDDDGSLVEEPVDGVDAEELPPEEDVAGAAEVVCAAEVVADVAGLDAVPDEEAGVAEPLESDVDAAGEDEEDAEEGEVGADVVDGAEVTGAAAAATALVTVLVAAATVLAGDDEEADEVDEEDDEDAGDVGAGEADADEADDDGVGAGVLDEAGAEAGADAVVVCAGAGELEAGAGELTLLAGELVAVVTALVTGAVALETVAVAPETRDEGPSADAAAAEIRPVPKAIAVTAIARRRLKRTLSMRGLCTHSAESHNPLGYKFPHRPLFAVNSGLSIGPEERPRVAVTASLADVGFRRAHIGSFRARPDQARRGRQPPRARYSAPGSQGSYSRKWTACSGTSIPSPQTSCPPTRPWPRV